MITFVEGEIEEKTPTELILDCQGIGYLIHISLHSYSLLPDSGRVRVFTHLHIKEDSHSLYGFAELEEREMFRLLIGVSGIGTQTARTVLSSLPPDQLHQAILKEDVRKIQAVKGIGAKTAQRVILDLKDKARRVSIGEQLSNTGSNTRKEEALSALEVLGYSRKQTEHVINQSLESNADLDVEDMIKFALKNL